MITIIQDSIQAVPELKELIAKANELLRADLEEKEPDLEAEWSLVRDEQNSAMVELRLSDQFGESAVRRITPKELGEHNLIRSYFYDLWGDLLQRRRKKHLERLHKLVQDL